MNEDRSLRDELADRMTAAALEVSHAVIDEGEDWRRRAELLRDAVEDHRRATGGDNRAPRRRAVDAALYRRADDAMRDAEVAY